MVLEAKRVHKDKHYGMNRFESNCNDLFFRIPRTILRKVVSECVKCSQSQPLKVKEKAVHITATRPLERLQIDLVDMRQYKQSNNEYAWLHTVIDVFSKFAWVYSLYTKTGKEVAENIETLFLTFTGPPQNSSVR
ncbi:hypothetical protein NGRA_2575 [Nosema granulosis]|uniref:Integrase catalytic domain-containing protein n=1 Tax=Nosema granulosis TaxID=83296 RepID=A0A9P6KYH8_9MICR|nr:hypothetical protein NGRA_2575 [Nosema granulosis]